ncbi:RDD family protein [Paracoccaceae bacterium Fryx2]|nr:RDD family protein [Paracoccaceae bacterium Fryx2]
METDRGKGPLWKRVIAGVLDFLLVFVAGGYGIAGLTGGRTEGGFLLTGLPAFALFVLMIAYFVGMNRFLGGTVFRHLFGIADR